MDTPIEKMNRSLPEQNPFDHILEMDNYTLIESAEEILNSLVAWCSREQIKEELRQSPDKNRLERLDAFVMEVINADCSLEDFSDDDGDNDEIRDIVRKYYPMLKKINRGEDLIQ